MSEFPVHEITHYIDKKRTINIEGTPIPKEVKIPNIDRLPRPLVEIAERVANLTGTWNPVELYTADPESIATERQKVFDAYEKGEEYNPTLTYGYANTQDLSYPKIKLEEQLHKLRQFGGKKKSFFNRSDKKPGKQTLDRDARLFRAGLYYKIKDDLATVDLVDGIKNKDDEMIASALSQKYPGTDQNLYDMAVAEYVRLLHHGPDGEEKGLGTGLLSLEEIEWLKGKEIPPEKVAEAYRWALKEYGILRTASNGRGFYVRVADNVTATDVRSKSTNGPTVYVPEDRANPITLFRLLELIGHEIEGHAVQEVNGEELLFLGGGRLKIDNEQLYEGKGMGREIYVDKKLFGIKDSSPAPYFTFGVKMAEEGASFYQIFTDQLNKRMRVHLKKPMVSVDEDLASQIDQKDMDRLKRQAWSTTYRVMRGHTDMSNKHKFAMAKDLAYMRGYQMDRQLQENDLGFLNEIGVITPGSFAALAEMKLTEKDLPIPFRDVATKYWEEVLKPQMKEEMKHKQKAA